MVRFETIPTVVARLHDPSLRTATHQRAVTEPALTNGSYENQAHSYRRKKARSRDRAFYLVGSLWDHH